MKVQQFIVAIPCAAVAGSYRVNFERKTGNYYYANSKIL